MRVKNSAVLGDFVYQHIREMILTKQIQCGEKIQEQAIEKQLGVSRTPVREAVRRLSNEGIIKLYPNRFAEVVTFDGESIRELGVVRVTLDCLAAQFAIQNGSNRDFAELKTLMDLCEEAHDSENIYEQIRYDSEFHLKLTEFSGNGLVLDVQRNLITKTMLLQATLLDTTASTACDVNQHKAILDALYDRDVDAVIRAVLDHLCPFYRLDPSDINTLVFPAG